MIDAGKQSTQTEHNTKLLIVNRIIRLSVLYLILMFASAVFTALLLDGFDFHAGYKVTKPSFASLYATTRYLMPTTLSFLAIFASVYTTFNRSLSSFIIMLYGISWGVMISQLNQGTLLFAGVSQTLVITVRLTVTLLTVFFASTSGVYSAAIIKNEKNSRSNDSFYISLELIIISLLTLGVTYSVSLISMLI